MLAFAMPGTTELLIIGVVVILLFGANALPKLARSAGKILPSFKAGMREVEREVKELENIGNEIKKDVEGMIKS